MDNFPPETYLSAARIADEEVITDGEHILIRRFDELNIFKGRTLFYPESHDYRALREALDKKYGITIRWYHEESKWLSVVIRYINGNHPIPTMLDDDITNLMMRNVQALINAGVVE